MAAQTDFKLFFKRLTIINFTVLILFGYPVWYIWGTKMVLSVCLGLVLTFSNTLIGFYFVDRYFKAEMKKFLTRVFGTMGIRLAVLSLLIILFLLMDRIDKNGFIISLFISYTYQSVLEMIFINKKASNRASEQIIDNDTSN